MDCRLACSACFARIEGLAAVVVGSLRVKVAVGTVLCLSRMLDRWVSRMMDLKSSPVIGDMAIASTRSRTAMYSVQWGENGA